MEAGRQLENIQSKSLGCILHLHFENLDKAFAPFGADWQDNDAAGTATQAADGGNSFGCLCLTDRSFNQ